MEYSNRPHSAFYDWYIHSEQWKFKRAQRLEIDGHKCCMCGKHEKDLKDGLRIHHINYNSLGHENIFSDICSLCPRCHWLMHKYWNRIRKPEQAIFK